MRSLPVLLLSFGCLCFGCLDTSVPTRDARPEDVGPDEGPDAPPPPRVLELQVLDQRGRTWPLDAAPTRPTLRVLTTELLDAPSPFVFLFDAVDVEALREDLGRSPVRQEHLRRVIETEVTADASGITMTPTATLEPGAYRVALAAWAAAGEQVLGEAFVAPFTVAADGGATLTHTWPPDGSTGVAYAIDRAILRFDGEVEGLNAIQLVGSHGAITSSATRSACEDVGWPRGSCVTLSWDGVLRPAAAYRVEIGEALVDRGGAPVGPLQVGFVTGRDAMRAPNLLPLVCGLDETPADLGCALADDARVTLRLRADTPVIASLTSPRAVDRQLAPRGEITLSLALGIDAAVDAELRLEGLAGETLSATIPLRTHPTLAAITIAEVRADPRGPEPRQEYVELLNYGASAVELTGLALSDRADRLGDELPLSPMLPAGARALLVADAFDPNDPADPPVPPGVMLVRIGTSLASGGLSNAGEPLFLRDTEGRRLSAIPSMASPGPGICWVRTTTTRAGELRAAECTPGTE